MRHIIIPLSLVACLLLASCKSLLLPKRDETVIAWGPVSDGVSCGISLSQKEYSLGENVAIRVYLKNASGTAITCHVSRIQSWKIIPESICRMTLLVDATDEQYTDGTNFVIPPRGTTLILLQEFPTRLANGPMSDLHFTPGTTPVRVICTPMFIRKSGPLLAGNLPGVSSGLVEVRVRSIPCQP